jgi:hypothetical protein
MRQRGYLIAFVLVLLTACAGGFFGGRLLIRRLQQDFGSQGSWAPPTAVPTTGEGRATPITPAAPLPDLRPTDAAPPAPSPAPTRIPVTVPAPAAAETLISEDASPEPAPTETETATPDPSPTPVFPYALAGALRHSTGDCPGSYILGRVTDRGGKPLADVRLRLVDEYGNEEFKLTKGGADAGRYDFPIFGPPRRFYLGVVDGGNRPLSPRIEIPHGVGANPTATCHWADWSQR